MVDVAMQVNKTESLNLLTRTFQVRNRDRLAVTIMAAFSLDGSGRLLDEAEVWTTSAASLSDGAMLDALFPKSQAEFLVAGDACSPEGKPVSALKVRVRIGPLSKTLTVLGDREWTSLMGDLVSLSRPIPFSRMPLTWDRAYGGQGFSHNPLGKGYTTKGERLHDRIPAPNVESADRCITSIYDQPEPVGFGPLDPAWPQRTRHGGTFNRSWVLDRWPGLPDDFDWTYFNAAPQDQRLDGFFRGDEPVVLENLHPERGLVESALPGLQARCFAVRTGSSDETVEELTLNLDTVWVFPNCLTGVLVWRGITAAADDEASDIRMLSAGIEPLAGPRRPIEFYFQTEEPEPLPPEPKPAESPVEEPTEATPEEIPKPEPDPDMARVQELLAKIEAEENEAMADLDKLGLHPDRLMPELREEISTLMQKPAAAPATVAELEQALAASEMEIRDVCRSVGFDIDAPQSLPSDLPASDPRSLKDMAADMRRSGLIDEETAAQMAKIQDETEAAERQVKELLKAEPDEPEMERLAEEIETPTEFRETLTREKVAGARDEGRRLTGEDLSGLDLSGLDLTGMDLTGVIAPGVILTGALLKQANLTGAVLTDARLNEADLSGAMLVNANLGGAEAEKAILANADLTGADLTGGRFLESDLTGARLVGTLLAEADLTRAGLRSADLSQADLNQTDLTEADLEGARAERADFSNAVLDRTRLVKLSAASSSWHGAHGTGTVLTGSDLSRSRADESTRLLGADFQQADMSRSNWDGADLSGAMMAHSNLDKASFSKTQLKSVNLYRARARQTRMDHADLSDACLVSVNLYQGDLTRARLVKTDLRGANLHEVEFINSNISGADLTDALLSRTKLEGWRRS